VLTLRPDRRGVLELLCLGAHSDDLEIGCGGAILELIKRQRCAVTWVVLAGAGQRGQEAGASAAHFLRGAQRQRVLLREFQDSYFPHHYREIKTCFEQLKREVVPDLIFTHAGADLHQDHRLVSELTWNTFRDQLILEYEIVKYDGGLGSPSVFMPLSLANYRRKLALLMSGFATQRSKKWFTRETFEGLMRIRGVECNAPSGYAEAFYARKIVL